MEYNFWTGKKVRLRAVEATDADSYYKWSYDYNHVRKAHSFRCGMDSTIILI
jgi:hypothetical protein